MNNGNDIKYPDYETLKAESEEAETFLLFTITDESGNVVRKLKQAITKGVNRVVWNFRYNAFTPLSLEPFDDSVPWMTEAEGYMVVPGNYYVSLTKYNDGNFSELVSPQKFVCKTLNNASIPAEDKSALDKFNQKVAELIRAIYGADSYRSELVEKLSYLKNAVLEGSDIPIETYQDILEIEQYLKNLNEELNGDNLRTRYEGARPTSVKERIDLIMYALWNTTAAPTNTFNKSYEDAASKFDEILNSLKLIDNDIKLVETTLEKNGAPYTPGRLPEWRKN